MKKTIKKLALNRESILRLDRSVLGEVVGGITSNCTATARCTNSCAASCDTCSGTTF